MHRKTPRQPSTHDGPRGKGKKSKRAAQSRTTRGNYSVQGERATRGATRAHDSRQRPKHNDTRRRAHSTEDLTSVQETPCDADALSHKSKRPKSTKCTGEHENQVVRSSARDCSTTRCSSVRKCSTIHGCMNTPKRQEHTVAQKMEGNGSISNSHMQPRPFDQCMDPSHQQHRHSTSGTGHTQHATTTWDRNFTEGGHPCPKLYWTAVVVVHPRDLEHLRTRPSRSQGCRKPTQYTQVFWDISEDGHPKHEHVRDTLQSRDLEHLRRRPSRSRDCTGPNANQPRKLCTTVKHRPTSSRQR